jgi:uncharacterized membrane protein YkvA (DUF1232 family)
MKNHAIIPINEQEFIDFIARGAMQLTSRDVHQLVAELPDLREQFAQLRASAAPETEQQLIFLADVVDAVWTGAYPYMPYSAALEAAFAVTYFFRETDLIPDSLGSIGFIDDAAVVHAVLARHADAYRTFCEAKKISFVEVQLVGREREPLSAG